MTSATLRGDVIKQNYAIEVDYSNTKNCDNL
jgi:hypothetical protein